MQNLVLGGSEALAITLTWALSLLLNNPTTLKKAQEEIDTVIGKDRRVTESDTEDLVYIHSVVKETLRLYPPNPVIAMHCASEDCTLAPDNYHIPKGTRLMVNIWKIQRDAKTWPQPTEFRPERFVTTHKDVDTKGYNFEYIPFGSGRRSCPGTVLGLRIAHFTLATLLHCFDISKSSDEAIDMTESPGLSNKKAMPLQVCLTPRLRPEIYGA